MCSEFDDEDPLAQWILKTKNSETEDEEDCLSLRDWARKNNLVGCNQDVLDEFEKVDKCLVTWEYPSEMDIVAALNETQASEEPESEEDEPESIFEPPTSKEVVNAMKTLSTYLSLNDFESNITSMYDLIQKEIEKSLMKKCANQKKLQTFLT